MKTYGTVEVQIGAFLTFWRVGGQQSKSFNTGAHQKVPFTYEKQ